MRLVVARRSSRRGEGLGNEMIPWAKGWIASQALDAVLVGPSWGLNRRKYWRNFKTSRLDFLLENALDRLPHFTFTEADYRASGEIDFGDAIVRWVDQKGIRERRSFLVSVGGMWGGYAAIRNARPFLWSRLLSSRDALANVYRVLAALDPHKLFVAIHIRSGGDGFEEPEPGPSQRGRFNLRISGDWYFWVCRELRRRFGDRAQFRFFTDRPNPDFKEAVRRFNPGQRLQAGLTECSDLLLMSYADLRVCSVSSYSMAASFLSGGPYLWYEPQLALRDGFYSLWGCEPEQQRTESATARSEAFVRRAYSESSDRRGAGTDFPGWAIDIGDPLPDALAERLEQLLRSKDSRTNLLEYGCLPSAMLSASSPGWSRSASCAPTEASQ